MTRGEIGVSVRESVGKSDLYGESIFTVASIVLAVVVGRNNDDVGYS